MTEPNPADMTARRIANQVCEKWEIAAFTQEWAIARDAAIAALQQSRSAVGMMYETLTYVSEASECELSRKAAAETLAKVDAALSQESADA